jgi:hypothetical protein
LLSGKIPDWQIRRTTDPDEKTRPEGLPRTGKVNVVGSTAPPMKMYHCAQGWKNGPVWSGIFPG